MATLQKTATPSDFQAFNQEVYGPADDRMYSLEDLLAHMHRFAMRSLKGVRKGDKEKIRTNLLISFSFLFAIANRLHIDLEEEMWARFPMQCSYCAHAPCMCKKIKPTKRPRLKIDATLRPHTLREFQTMFNVIYPAGRRTEAEAGMHLAEEIGEVAEAMHNYRGQHHQKQLAHVTHEITDCASCIFGLATSVKIDVAKELAELFKNNCHVCHKAPCVCTFAVIANGRL